jgi:hypothetical protein
MFYAANCGHMLRSVGKVKVNNWWKISLKVADSYGN